MTCSHSWHPNHSSLCSLTESPKPNYVVQDRLAKVLKKFNSQFSDIVNSQSLLLTNCDQCVDDYIAPGIPKTINLMLVWMQQNEFGPVDVISIFNFQSTFKTSCDRNGGSEGYTMCPFHFCIRIPIRSVFNIRMHLGKWSQKSLKNVLYSYYNIILHLLDTNSTNEGIFNAVN